MSDPSSKNGDSSAPPDPRPLAAAEAAAEDRRTLRLFLLWLGFWALLGAAFLVFAIWVDWT